jgi:hypothetical protein
MLALEQMLASQADVPSANVTRQRRALFNNAERAVEMGAAVVLNPANGRNLSELASRNLAMNRSWLGLADTYSDAGWLRESAARVNRQWRGGIGKALRDLGVIDGLSGLQREMDGVLKKYRLSDADLTEVVITAQEVGWLPYMKKLANPNPMAVRDLERQFTEFADELVSRFGLNPDDAAAVLRIGGDASKQFSVAGEIGQEAGANFEKLDNLGYFERIMNSAAAERFNWRMKKEPGMGELFEFNDGKTMTGGTVINKGRSTHRFLVYDEVILDYVIRTTSSRLNGSDPMAIYRRVLGLSELEAVANPPSIAQLLDSNRAVERLLLGELPDDIISSLTEMGTLVKMPMQTREVYKKMISTYELPFKGLNEVFSHDFNTGVAMYTKQLETLTAQSGEVGLMFGHIIRENIGVPRHKFEADPQKYKQFVPLVGDNGVLTPEMAERLGLTDPVLSGLPDNWAAIRGYYVHPTAANIMRARLEIQTSVGAMSAIGNMFEGLAKNFREFATITVGFIPRQYANSMFQVAAGGGNILAMGRHSPIIGHHYLQGKPLADAFSSEAQYAGGLSARDIVQQMIDKGFISDYEPLAGVRLNPTGRGSGRVDAFQAIRDFDPKGITESIARDMRWAYHAAVEHKDLGRALKEAGSLPGYLTNPVVRMYQLGNNSADVVGRIAAVLSTMRMPDGGWTRALPEPTHYLRSVSGNGRRFNTVDEAIEHWQNYFYFYDDASKMDDTLRQLVPFWGFHSKNVPAAIRHAIRHPSRYAAFNRIVAWSNQAQMYGTDEINEGTVPEWALHTVPMFFRREGTRADGGDNWYSIGLSNLDPFSGAYGDFVEAPISAAFEALGIWQDDQNSDPNYRRTRGTTSERLDRSIIGTNTQNRLLEILSDNLFPHLTAGVELVMAGINSANGSERRNPTINTFLGFEMSPILENLISAVIPAAATLNRINPGGRFGTKGYYDSNTGRVVPDQLSFAGSIRTDNDSFNRSNLPFKEALNIAGLRVQPIDVLANAGNTIVDMRVTAREAASLYKRARQQAMTLPAGSRQQQDALDRLPAIYAMTTQLLNDLDKFEKWAESKGMDVDAAREALMKSRMNMGDVEDTRSAQEIREFEQSIRDMNGVSSDEATITYQQGTVLNDASQ